MKIGEKIKQRRNELGWSQRELAARIKYKDHSTVAKIENGKVDLPQSKIVKFAEVLGVEVSYLMDWEEVQKNNEAISDITVKLRSDEDLLSLVTLICQLDKEKIESVKHMLNTFLK